ncbi:hypothetical protein [Bacillus sp. FJAT-44742]|uniref:hypothetical protein n=1 Tax=Bacillus sp. FJAT-44742 TaxID=2014005 RepID=UPI000C2394FF|nr:hypothetical protein [Bacillus sp. FJAT-44742]
MLFNILFGFVLPWILGIVLYKKDKQLMVKTTPICVLIAFVMNIKGSRYWILRPRIKRQQYRTIYPLNFGYFPVVASFMVFCSQKSILPKAFWVLLFTVFSTTAELLAILSGKLIYKNGWNIYKTLFTYIVPYFFMTLYYDLVKK